MTIAILATGDEIINGDTLNTNSHSIAHALSSEGLPVGLQMSCPDREHSIFKGLQFLSQEHEIIILTGGLGPTSDDRTRFALAKFLEISLEEHPDAVSHVKKILTRAGLTMNSRNRQQALFPRGAKLLSNPNGTAMGCYYVTKTTSFILLPGPPKECLPMFNKEVLPRLRQTQHTGKELLKWRLFGVAEGEVAHMLDDALSAQECETGYRLDTPYVEFKVRCQQLQTATIRRIIEPLIASYIIATPDVKASERLRGKISTLLQPIGIIDDVTGGLLQTLLQRPGNSHLVRFHSALGVSIRFHLKGLDEYWADESSKTVSVAIQYEDNGQQGKETFTIPFRSPMVVHYAAEWLCFRLFHLINQLHQ